MQQSSKQPRIRWVDYPNDRQPDVISPALLELQSFTLPLVIEAYFALNLLGEIYKLSISN